MLPSNPVLLLRPQPVITSSAAFAQGVLFNGASPTYLQKASGPFTGAVNSNQITLSFWFRMNGAVGDGAFRILFEHASQGGLNIFWDNNNFLQIAIYDATFTPAITMSTNGVSSYTSADTSWHHVYYACDNSATSGGSGTLGDLWIDGASGRGGFIQTSGNAFAFGDTSAINLGARGSGSIPTYADIAALWIDYGHYQAPNSTNVQKFRSLAGHPVNLGSDGSAPFSRVPIAFFDNPPGTFGTNLGSGGNLAVGSGTLVASSSGP